MEEFVPQGLSPRQQQRTLEQLATCNEASAQFGVTLSHEDAVMLTARRFQALQSNGRIEFGEGVLSPLARAFFDSPYINQQNYAETLAELQDLFYALKTDAQEQLADDDIIFFLRRHFDTDCAGSLERLQDLTTDELCRRIRSGVADTDTSDMDQTDFDEEEAIWDNL